MKRTFLSAAVIKILAINRLVSSDHMQVYAIAARKIEHYSLQDSGQYAKQDDFGIVSGASVNAAAVLSGSDKQIYVLRGSDNANTKLHLFETDDEGAWGETKLIDFTRLLSKHSKTFGAQLSCDANCNRLLIADPNIKAKAKYGVSHPNRAEETDYQAGWVNLF